MFSVISDRGNPSNPYLERIKLVQGDITRQRTDAIVSVLPHNLEYRGELNTSILEAAGQKLDEFVLEHIFQPRAGDIYAVPSFNLPSKHIFFAILPRWSSDFDREDKHLLIACRKAMEMTRTMCLSSVSFPPLAAGKHGYPAQKVARITLQAILERMDESFKEVRIVSKDVEILKLFYERLKPLGWTGSTSSN
jgi:O-acetyl-ADP-ribose deacetylase (regulator of RNase III)